MWSNYKIYCANKFQNVDELHSKGIVHNDLKEENLLWDSNTLIILDFGGAEKYPSYSSICTRGYKAPESVRTPASDVYSCGVIFLNLVRFLSILLPY